MASLSNIIKIDEYTGIYFKDINNIFKDIKSISVKRIQAKVKPPYTLVLKYYIDSKIKTRTHHITDLSNTIRRNCDELQAQRKILSLNKELEENTKNLKLHNLFEEYIVLKKEVVSDEYIKDMKTTFNIHLKELHNLNIINIKTNDIQRAVNKILRDGKSTRLAQKIKQLMRPLLKYAIDLEILERNAALKVTIPKFDNTVDFSLSKEKAKELFKNILEYPIPIYKGIMLFLMNGRRFNEVITLLWENIDLENGTYTIVGKYAKNRKKHIFYLSSELIEILNHLQGNKSIYVFPSINNPNKTLAHGTFRKHWDKLTKETTDISMRIHDTRHLLGGMMVYDGESLESISKVLGHSSTAVTKRYSKTSLNTAKRVIDSYLDKLR